MFYIYLIDIQYTRVCTPTFFNILTHHSCDDKLIVCIIVDSRKSYEFVILYFYVEVLFIIYWCINCDGLWYCVYSLSLLYFSFRSKITNITKLCYRAHQFYTAQETTVEPGLISIINFIAEQLDHVCMLLGLFWTSSDGWWPSVADYTTTRAVYPLTKYWNRNKYFNISCLQHIVRHI